MKRVVNPLDRFLFSHGSAKGLALCRIVLCGLLGIYFKDWNFSQYGLSAELYQPVSFFKILPLFSVETLYGLERVWWASLFFSVLGVATRPSLVVAALLGCYFLGLGNCFGKINNFGTMPAWGLLILALSRCADEWSCDELWRRWRGAPQRWIGVGAYAWPLKLFQVFSALGYFAAGFQKLRDSGWQWAFSDNLQQIFLYHQMPFGLFLAQFPLVTQGMAFLALSAETLAPLALFFPLAAGFCLPNLFILHIGTWLTMGANGTATPYLFCFVFWIPWHQVAWTRSPQRGSDPLKKG